MRLLCIACLAALAACSSSSPSGPSVKQEVPSTIVAGDASSCLLTDAGQAYCWGSDSLGQLGVGSSGGVQATPTLVLSGQTYTAISGSEFFRCALSSGVPGCWGQTLA